MGPLAAIGENLAILYNLAANKNLDWFLSLVTMYLMLGCGRMEVIGDRVCSGHWM
jgi:hypothetical protein